MIFTELSPSMFRKSASIQVDIQDTACMVTLPADKKRIHVIQLQKYLNLDNSFFCAEIISLSKLVLSELQLLQVYDSLCTIEYVFNCFILNVMLICSTELKVSLRKV